MSDLRALLGALAVPRLVGTPAHARVRERLRHELTARGFVVLEHRFAAAPRPPLHGAAPAEGVNLIAVRPRARVETWLAAHYDSKGQPFSMATRLLVVSGAVLAVAATAAALIARAPALRWGAAAVVLAAVFLVGNRVTDRSPGAVDNATGVLAVLHALDALPGEAPVGALLLDAEEWGLVGARALARERAHLLRGTVVINFDGIDDRGGVTAFVHRPGPVVDQIVVALGARAWRLLPVLVDGIALARASGECVTLMKGGWSTMRVIHTPQDTADRLRLEGVQDLGRWVARAISPG